MIIGIVGKPSAGKSTFFKASTLKDVAIANYPFTTIHPNSAAGFVKIECVDKEFNVQCNPREGYCIDNKRFVPIELIDVAGLVPGAHEGKGRGNQFLDDLNPADALIHVVDISGSVNENGEPVEPLSYDPLKDVEFLEYEIEMWFLNSIRRGWAKFVRQSKMEKSVIYKAVTEQLSGFKVTEEIAEKVLKNFDPDLENWTESDLVKFAKMLREITKPILIAANKIDVPGAEKNFERIKERFPDYIIIPCSAECELALKEAAKKKLIKYIPGENNFEIIDHANMSEQQKKALEFIKVNILDKYGSTGVQNVLDNAVFNVLNYIAIFPGGVNNLVDSHGRVIPDCLLLKKGSTALDFAFKIHTDIGINFVRAIDAKTRLSVGKDHALKHRDVIEIKTSK